MSNNLASKPISLKQHSLLPWSQKAGRVARIERLRVLAQQRLTEGEMVCLEIPGVAAPHPWVPFAGSWKDHPDLDAVLEHIAEARRHLDAAESEA